ncbi:MAG: EamA family transporter [Microbacteriaceae bacterium]|nr:EamA family transporter [Microbacteriaceae bacterium]
MVVAKPRALVGYIAATVAAFIFGVNGVVIKLLMDGTGIDGFQVTFLRVVGAAVLMGAVLLTRDPNALRITRKQIVPLLAMGVVGVAMLQATYAQAVFMLPIGIALLLEYTAVLFVALIAHFFFREHVKSRIWVSIVAVLIGLATVAEVWNSTLNAEGVLWAFAASASLTTYFLLGERQTGVRHPMAVGFWGMTVASAFWALFSGWWTLDPVIFTRVIPFSDEIGGISGPAWLLLAFIVVLGTFTTFTLGLWSISILKATRSGIVATSEVLFAFLAAWLILGETLNVVQLVGAGIVLIGVVLAQSARDNRAVQSDLALDTSEISLPKDPR